MRGIINKTTTKPIEKYDPLFLVYSIKKIRIKMLTFARSSNTLFGMTNTKYKIIVNTIEKAQKPSSPINVHFRYLESGKTSCNAKASPLIKTNMKRNEKVEKFGELGLNASSVKFMRCPRNKIKRTIGNRFLMSSVTLDIP